MGQPSSHIYVPQTQMMILYFAAYLIQWNLNITKCQGTGKIYSLSQGFIISRYSSICFTITGVKKIVFYTEDFCIQRFVISRFHCKTFSPSDLNFLEQPVKIQQNKLYNSKVLSTLTFFMAPCHWVMFFLCAFVKWSHAFCFVAASKTLHTASPNGRT